MSNNKKTTLRYFAGEEEHDSLKVKDLIDSPSGPIKLDSKSGQVVNNWKNESRREKLFQNNRFVSKEKLKKYQRTGKLDNVI